LQRRDAGAINRREMRRGVLQMKTKDKETKPLDGFTLIGEVNEGKLKAYAKEYPWLIEHLPSVIKSLKTGRANEIFLARKLSSRTIGYSDFDCFDDSVVIQERVLFFTAGGTFCGEAGVIYHSAPKRTLTNWFPKPYDTQINETVAEAIVRIEGELSECHEVWWYTDTASRCAYLPYFTVSIFDNCVTVYKPPKLEEHKLENPFPAVKLLHLATFVMESASRADVSSTDKAYEDALAEIRSV
jgi:hypothetical protein